MNTMFLLVVFLLIPATSAFDSTQTNRTIVNSTITTKINGSSIGLGTCSEFTPQSCSGVCGQFFELWCSCDEYCQVYRRCCFDYEAVCKEESEKSKQDHENLMNVTVECDSNMSGVHVPQQRISPASG
ncbi:hypothetical protein LOTGIDRAFT_175543 [Lottia gigantea]|uniref:SMB domain-containing protein n=1 Tax=Lottia gigantea TaxID=225164 RepID=V4BWR5_LOTGI|nr:hypothetical protein LOTGIDRAFT_175543 [Lottia gigantea]ESO93464.1 hypothetical protein LOTGIDRAFT_175543 [Lottia gigantea]